MQIAGTIKGALTSYTDTAEFMHECKYEFHKLNNTQLIAVSARSKPCSRVARRRSRHLPLLPEHLSYSVRTWAWTTNPPVPSPAPYRQDKRQCSISKQTKDGAVDLCEKDVLQHPLHFLAVCMKWMSSIKVGIWLIIESNRQPGLPVMSICLSIFIMWSSCELGKQYLLGDFR